MSVLKKLAGEAALYGMSSIVGRMLNYLLVPFYTAIFAPAEYGVLTYLYACAAFLNVVYTFGMETAYFRFSSKFPKEQQTYYNLAFTAVTAVSITVSAMLVWSATLLSNGLNMPGTELFIGWLVLTMAIDGIVAIPFARLRLEKKAKKFVTIRLSNIFLNILFNLLFLLLAPKMADGAFGQALVPVGQFLYRPEIGVGYVFLSNMLANFLILPMLKTEISAAKFQINWELQKPMVKYAYPILLMGLAGITSEMLGRIALENWLPKDFYHNRSNMEALGIYGACYKLSIFMQMSIQAFKYAAEPFFFSQASDKNAPDLFAVVMKWFVIACVGIFVLVSINLNWLAPIFIRQSAYLEGLIVVPILLLANMFLGIYYNLTAWFKLTDKTHYGSMMSIGGAIATVLLNFLLIPIGGYVGSAVATLLCYFGMAVACYKLGQKHYPVPYDVRSALFYTVVGSLLVMVSWQTQKWPTGMYLLATALLHLVFAAIILGYERIPLAKILRRK
jgi:O-antigen/teichoic acid export membrane protein